MANISKRLKELFNSYLERLAEERGHSTNYGCRSHSYTPSQSRLVFDDDDSEFCGIIYFYEWSDINRTPKAYYTLRAFENFLVSSQIYLASYQKELIRNIHNPYITCRKDGKDLIIKCNYESLKHALETEDRPTNPFRSPHVGSEDREPYSVAITRPPHKEGEAIKVASCSSSQSVIRRPPMYMENENRWDGYEEMQPELGGCWGW